MVSRVCCTVLLFLSLVSIAAAETPVATISSTNPFELRGARVPVAGVPSWPLVRGDVIATTTSAAVVSFPDHSQATVEKGSRVEIQGEGNHTTLKLLEGSLLFRWTSDSGVQLKAAERTVAPQPGSQVTVSVTKNGRSNNVQVSNGGYQVASKPKPPPPPPPPSPSQ
jgi:ferric-dicitrate binding protein FerR (iron transport regulator)